MKIKSALLLLILLLFALSGCSAQSDNPGSVQNGFLDLSEWDFAAQGNVSLDGNWAFYWNRLLSPDVIDGVTPTGYCELPSGWEKYSDLSLPAFGTATYRLVVKTDAAAGVFSIYVPNVYTDYELWINDTVLHTCGSFTQEKSVYLHPQVYDFYYDGAALEIVLQVHNDKLIYGGGVWQSIRFGTAEQMSKEYIKHVCFDLSLVSICIFVGLFFLVFYNFRKTSFELIWLFVLCISVSVRNLLSNTTLLMQAFPALPFWLGSRLVMLSIPFIIISMLLYSNRLYKRETPRVPFYILLSLNAAYALIVVFTSPTFYMTAFVPYMLVVGAASIFGIYISILAVKHRRREAVFFFTGMLLLALGAALDCLVYLGVISSPYMLTVALFCFIIIQAVLLSKSYTDAFLRTKRLSAELQMSLDTVMNTETAYMSAQMKPHFLYNALSTIAEFCETDPHEAGRLILSLSKYLRQTLDYDNLSGIVPLKKELELVRAYASIECARFENISVVFDVPDPLPLIQIPPLTLQPLVENAIKHGLRKKREGGRVIVSVKQEENKTVFTVEDNGVGMSEEAIKKLMVLPNGSDSIGLYNINTRLNRLFGQELCIKSETDTGTSVSFQIPR